MIILTNLLSLQLNLDKLIYDCLDPLIARILTIFGQFIRGQSVTQRSMGREAARYPPQYLGP